MTGETQRRRVLVVDDDREIRNLLAAVLRRRDLAVDTVANGGEAIAHLRRNVYAVLLLDLFMPDVDGFAVLEAMREGAFASQPVVLVMTGAERATYEPLDAQLIHGVVRKPFEPEELASVVLACADIKSHGSFGTMAIATMVAGGPLLALLNKLT